MSGNGDAAPAVGVLALPAEERNECLDWIGVQGNPITLHVRHVCRRNFPHDEHRCCNCTVTWRSRDNA